MYSHFQLSISNQQQSKHPILLSHSILTSLLEKDYDEVAAETVEGGGEEEEGGDA
jgi:hypothetical protein